MGGRTNAPANVAAKRNVTYRANHAAIRDAYLDMLREKGRKPTLEEIASASNLSIQTVHKHLKELEFVPRQHELRILTDDVIIAVYQGAVKGNGALARLWFELMEGWSPQLRLSGGDSEGLTSVLIIPHNNRDSLQAIGAITDVEWEEIEQEVKSQ